MSERRRTLFVLLLVLGLIAASAVVVATKETKLGLDLQGGVQLVYEGKPTPQQPTVTQESLDRALDIMRERVDAFGVAEPELQLLGAPPDRGQPPGRRGRRARGRAGRLHRPAVLLRLGSEHPRRGLQAPTRTSSTAARSRSPGSTRPSSRPRSATTIRQRRERSASAPRFYAFDKVSKQPFDNGADVRAQEAALAGPGRRAARAAPRSSRSPTGVLVVRDEKPDPASGKEPPAPTAGGSCTTSPALSRHGHQEPRAELRPAGRRRRRSSRSTSRTRAARRSRTITRAIAQRGADNALPGRQRAERLAALRDRARQRARLARRSSTTARTRTASTARRAPRSPAASRSQTAQDLAKILKIGALPIKLELISRSQVSATLGKQALDQGLIAGIAGFVIVALFLIVFYRVLGVIAAVALAIYALYFYALVKLIPVTLTLPGIAGLILTLGVAADANIVIFERVKEEVRAGRSVGAAIADRLQEGPDGDRRRQRRHVPRRVHPLHPRHRGRQGLRVHARPRRASSRCSPRCSPPRRSCTRCAARGCSAARAALGAGEQRFKFRFDFMGASKWFFSMSGRDPADRRAGDRGQRAQLRHRLRVAARGSPRRSSEAGDGRRRAQRARAATGLDDAKIQTVDNPELGKNVVQISTATLEPREVDEVEHALRDAFGLADAARRRVDRPDVRPERRQLGDHRDHRVADRDLDLHRAAVRVEVRGAGADRADARHPDHGRRLRPHSAGR